MLHRQPHPPSPARLLLTPRISTALAHLVSRIAEAAGAPELIRLTVLLPTAGALHDLRRRLGDTMGVRMLQFYRLGVAVLDEAGIPVHEINDAAVRRLLRRILGELHDEERLPTFDPLFDKPGFVEVILDWVREMKSQGISPEQYADHARMSGDPRDSQLADIYTRYQDFMQRRSYSDADGLLWLTAEALEKDHDLFRCAGPLYVLGYDQFTPVQVRILQQLSGRFNPLNVYLLWDERRAAGSLALARLQQTRNALLDNIPFQVEALDEESSSSPALGNLHRALFESARPVPFKDEGISLIEAPSREAEVRRAVMEIKRLLLEGVAPPDIALLAPNLQVYLPIVRCVAAEYGVPIQHERPLTDNPAGAALLNLLALPPDFPWQGTFEALRSPYIRQAWLSEEQIELLARLGRERPVLSGLDHWRFAVQPLDFEGRDAEDEDLGPPPLVATLPPETLAAVGEGLLAFFDHLTPPESASYRDYTWWVQTALLGLFPETETPDDEAPQEVPTLDLQGRCRQSPFPRRDVQALSLAVSALRRLVAASRTVPTEEAVPWDTYREELVAMLRALHIPSDPLQAVVRFGRLEAGRARVVDHLFVLGLSKGEFPTPPPPDVLYAPDERENHPLPLMRYTPADYASLWWQVTGGARQRLTLLRPYIDDNGAPWEASPYWDAVRECFNDLEADRISIAVPPRPESAASSGELLVALAQLNSPEIPESLIGLWDYAREAERVMQQRQGYHEPDVYDGILQDNSLLEELARRFGPAHVWSASRLSRYANCPFGFFAGHVLRLEACIDPQEGLNAMQRGSILHGVLERLYQKLIDAGLQLIVPNQDAVLQYLEDSCAQVFPAAPQRYGFRPGALWVYEQQELQRMLRNLVIWECEQNKDAPRFEPYLLEAAFGIQGFDQPPLDINVDGVRFRLRGLIDRLDRDAGGNLRVLDYKSGSTKYTSSDFQKGLALQTALYALAAEKYWTAEGGRIAESSYWHIPIRDTSGELTFQGAVCEDADAGEVIRLAALMVERVRGGVFPSAPAKPVSGAYSCRSSCDFAPVCRVSRQSIARARRGGFS